jgi:hypothetical protein
MDSEVQFAPRFTTTVNETTTSIVKCEEDGNLDFANVTASMYIPFPCLLFFQNNYKSYQCPFTRFQGCKKNLTQCSDCCVPDLFQLLHCSQENIPKIMNGFQCQEILERLVLPIMLKKHLGTLFLLKYHK